MTPQLVPVQRPDKNGKMVTRHVRPETASAAQKGFPKVLSSNASSPLRKAAKEIVSSTIDGNPYEDTNLKPKAELFSNMDRLSNQTIDSYLAAMEEQPNSYHQDLLLSVLNNADTDAKAQYVLAIAKLDKEIDPEWGDFCGGTYHYHSATQVLSGLEMYQWSGFVPPKDITDESDPAVGQALALITVINRMWENGDEEHLIDGTMSINDGNLVSLILEHPEQAEQIAEIVHSVSNKDGRVIRFILDHSEDAPEIIETVRTTGTTDVQRLKDMMGNKSKSMRSGVL